MSVPFKEISQPPTPAQAEIAQDLDPSQLDFQIVSIVFGLFSQLYKEAQNYKKVNPLVFRADWEKVRKAWEENHLVKESDEAIDDGVLEPVTPAEFKAAIKLLLGVPLETFNPMQFWAIYPEIRRKMTELHKSYREKD